MRQIGNAMNGNDDYFGGSINPAPVPNASPSPVANVYAPPGSPAGPVKSTSMPAVPIFLLVVGALLAVAALVGYRAMTSGTDIVLPDNLLGMERLDPDSQMAQEIERRWTELDTYFDGDVELHVGTYGGGTQFMIIAAGETGLSDAAKQDEYFAGFSGGFNGGFNQSGSQTDFAEANTGKQGGRMQCFDFATAGITTEGCTWIADDTFGVVVMTEPELDIAEATRTVREAIEQ